jgi:hypothetical protein
MTTKQIPDAMDISTLVNPLAAAEAVAGFFVHLVLTPLPPPSTTFTRFDQSV